MKFKTQGSLMGHGRTYRAETNGKGLSLQCERYSYCGRDYPILNPSLPWIFTVANIKSILALKTGGYFMLYPWWVRREDSRHYAVGCQIVTRRTVEKLLKFALDNKKTLA